MSPTVNLLSKEETYRHISPRAWTVTYLSVCLPLRYVLSFISFSATRYFIYFTSLLQQGILLFVLESLDRRLTRQTGTAALKKKKTQAHCETFDTLAAPSLKKEKTACLFAF